MKMKKLLRTVTVLVSVVALTMLSACSQEGPQGGTAPNAPAGTSLRTDYSGALDVTSQLALGILRLEDTEDAVTEEQATSLLPLWQTLMGSGLKSEDEKAVVRKQIERTLTENQVAAIAAMQLTEKDAEAWGEESASEMAAGGGFPGGLGGGAASAEDRAAMREQFQNMSEEDRAAMREQMGGDANGAGSAGAVPGARASGGAVVAGSSTQLIRAVVMVLTEHSGQEAGFAPPQGGPGQPPAEGDAEMPESEEVASEEGAGEEEAEASATTPEPDATPTAEPVAAADDQAEVTPEPAIETPAPTATPKADADAPAVVSTTAEHATEAPATTDVAAATEEETADEGTTGADAAAAPATTAGATADAAGAVDETAPQTVANTAPPAALVQVEDTNPGPPFSVEISLNRAVPNPLLDGTTIYKVTGLLRNDGDEVYAVNTVNFTFYDADGFHGAFYKFPDRRYGEWIPHGAMEADFDCMLLAPGEVCPFEAEIAAYEMGSFYVHADAVVADWREPVPVEVQNTTLVDQGSNVRISGTIVNNNTYAIKNVVVCGALVDANGQMTSIGSDYYVQPIAAGAAVEFDVLIPADTCVTYQLFTQAEGDFK
ncbi:MAG: FxLYD domain-containing protein [Anaerolineae bacterium]